MAELVFGESVLADESLGDYEALRAFFQVAEERGHPAPSVVVDEAGRVITHPDYVDRMGAVHLRAGAWAFCRRQAAEALGLPSGTDWIRDHVTHLMFNGGSPYRNIPHFHSQLYVQQFDSSQPHLMMPVCAAHPVAWSNDGSRICVLEERLGHLTDYTRMAKYVLWEYELALGKRRLVAGFPAEERLDFVELGYSPDNRWIHICEWASGRNLLVRSSDGLIVPLPITSSAVSWNPRAGASVMTVMVTDGESGSLVVHDYDLTSDRLSRRSEVRSPTGLPLSVRELSMSVDERAVVTAPVGLVGVEQLRRGGVHIAAVIDVDYGEIDPVLPVRYRTPSTQRRHTSPRWCDDRTVLVASRTVLADQLINAGVFPDCEPDAPTISHDHLNRWLEILDGVEAAWRTSAMPKARFAQDYAQYAISCTEIDPEATEDMLGRLRQLADYETVPRTVLAWISTGYRLWPPLPDDVQSPGTDPTAIHFASDQASAAEKAVGAALDLLVAANRTDEAISAVRQLLYTAHHAGQDPEKVWAWFGSLGFAALRSGSYGFVAKVALATRIWNTVLVLLDRSVTAYGLRPTSSADVLPILLNGFEACTHLPERQILGRNVRHMIDVENLRNWCQAGLSHLPLDDYLTSVARPTRPQIQAPAVPNPAITRDRETESRLVGKKKVFISYLREDAVAVDRLASELASAGIEVWLDRTRLNPAVIWKREIRRAIRDHDYFVACFSSAYAQRGKTYMNEELRLAVEQLRLMPLDRRWFIPVVLDACRVPDFDIDATTTLEDLQYLDFAEDWDTAMAKLINLIHPEPEA